MINKRINMKIRINKTKIRNRKINRFNFKFSFLNRLSRLNRLNKLNRKIKLVMCVIRIKYWMIKNCSLNVIIEDI